MKQLPFAVILLMLISALMIQPACYYDNEEELYGTTTNVCDTVGMSYAIDIQPIIQNNCISCHSTTGVQSSSPFELYADVKFYADNGQLVTRTNDALSPMPQTGLMSECNRLKLRAWVNAGAPNN